jgi:hypothetical protein
MAQQVRERMSKWDFIQLKRFCTATETVTRLKRLPENERKSLPAIHLIRD